MPPKGLLNNHFTDTTHLHGSDVGMIIASYILGKYSLRCVVGCKPDARGWGLETYISAFIHQFVTTCAGLALIASHINELDAWLAAPWGHDQRAERLILLMQATEMATDMVRDRIYSGFGSSYLHHHVATTFAALAALYLTVPVGGVLAFATFMEAGGMCLNAVSLFGPLMAACEKRRDGRFTPIRTIKPPQWLLNLRVVLFCGSRLLAALILAKTTTAAMALERPPWGAIAFAWLIVLVNSRWVSAMVRSALARKDGMDTFCD